MWLVFPLVYCVIGWLTCSRAIVPLAFACAGVPNIPQWWWIVKMTIWGFSAQLMLDSVTLCLHGRKPVFSFIEAVAGYILIIYGIPLIMRLADFFAYVEGP